MAIKISGTTVINDSRGLENITDLDQIIRTPTITAPTSGSTQPAAGLGMTITLSEYIPIYDRTQASIQYQIDNNSDFSSVNITDTVTTTSNSITISDITSLSTSTTHYVRARYIDEDGATSDWSSTITFVTPSTYISIVDPTITSPSNGATGQGAQITVTTSAFATLPSGQDTHASTDWQLSTNSSFTNIISQSIGDTSNKTSYLFPYTLSTNTTYYVRARHNGASLGASAYTPTVSFTTAASFAGEQLYASSGTYSWTAPAGVSSVHVLAVGAGGGQTQGQAGALAWKNNISVSPGSSYTVQVGLGSSGNGGNSYFLNNSTVRAAGGTAGYTGLTYASYTGDGGGGGGYCNYQYISHGGGGGAGGYTGNGGLGGQNYSPGTPGAGGGGGGGYGYWHGGGGVGIYGQGPNGAGGYGSGAGNQGPTGPGQGGSGGTPGGQWNQSAYGGTYGGGASSGPGGQGAVRILWGPGRAWPTTNVT